MPGGQPRTIPKRWFFLWAAVVVPGAAVLTLLVLLNQLAMWPAIFGGTLGAVALFFVVRTYLADFDTVIAYIGDLARDKKPQAPEPRAHSAADEILSAVRTLNRTHDRRTSELETLAEANVTILDSIPDPLLLLNRVRQIRQANRAARGLVTANPIGQDLASVIRDPALLEEVDIALETRSDREALFTLPYPRLQHFLVRITPLAKVTADGTALIVSLHDLTAMKQLEQTRVDFIANVSHELRTPLATLVGFIETLQGPAKDDAKARAHFLEIMDSQTKRMVRLVEDLLSLSRIELSEHLPPADTVPIDAVLKTVRDMLSLEAKSHGITIALDLPEDLPEVPGSRDELTQLFQNLIDNAIKYGGTDTTIRIEARRAERSGVVGLPGPALSVRVQDEGEGIAPEHLARLTERFYRIDRARSRELGGTGLGLAIVKHIVNRHRGRLTIESALGRGSTFTVFLPLEAGPAS
ncbi:MAG: hypothetical protein J4G10_00625 [Alphaproteobacteria bacterium]|nr:hypothetical protein [Alphaproteobacteria bacterium]